MSDHNRFSCPSASLALRQLLTHTRKSLLVGLGLATAGHLCLLVVQQKDEQQRAAKPLTTHFVKRAPRLTKPLELKKLPRPKRRMLRRQMVSVKAHAERQQLGPSLLAAQVARSLARPRVDLTGSIVLPPAGLEPLALSEQIQGERDPDQKVDVSLELLNVDALDTGQFQAMVVQDSRDKRKLKGFFHFAGAYTPSIETTVTVETCLPQFKKRVVEAMTRFTDIKTDAAGTYTLDSRELLRIPWIFINAGTMFKLTGAEADNLGRYLVLGGFVFAETWAARPGGPDDVALQGMFKDALHTQELEYGRDWTFQALPNDHPVYHCYFDFDGPPAGYPSLQFSKDAHWGPLYGITIGNRLLAIKSTMDIEGVWNWWMQISPNYDNTRALQFLVNMIVFALTQEGSIAQQLTEGIGNW